MLTRIYPVILIAQIKSPFKGVLRFKIVYTKIEHDVFCSAFPDDRYEIKELITLEGLCKELLIKYALSKPGSPVWDDRKGNSG